MLIFYFSLVKFLFLIIGSPVFTYLSEKTNSIFELNEKNLLDAKPDLIISQETCEVCAAYTTEVKTALEILPKKPELYSMDPHNLNEIIQSVIKLGKILQKEEKALEIVHNLRQRIENIQNSKNEKTNFKFYSRNDLATSKDSEE